MAAKISVQRAQPTDVATLAPTGAEIASSTGLPMEVLIRALTHAQKLARTHVE
jgi:acyl-CoA synthetase (AMP-forming)/AMP-acid ligase II